MFSWKANEDRGGPNIFNAWLNAVEKLKITDKLTPEKTEDALKSYDRILQELYQAQERVPHTQRIAHSNLIRLKGPSRNPIATYRELCDQWKMQNDGSEWPNYKATIRASHCLSDFQMN